jgi:hypothetical protein
MQCTMLKMPDQARILSKNWQQAVCLIILGAACAFIGIYCAGVGLHDPDTCWLLSLGRLITTDRTLPSIDPYSFTWGLSNFTPQHRLVIYQWLSEVVFYNIYRVGQLPGLLIACAVVFALAIVALPFGLSRRLGAPWWWSLATVVLGVFACCWHFFVRPEVFALLMLSAFLWFVSELRMIFAAATASASGVPTVLDTVAAKRAYLCIAALSMTMAVWCNLHCTFVVGLQYVFSLVVVYACAQIPKARRRGNVAPEADERRPFVLQIRLAVTAALCCVMATLVNPYGVGLWSALPALLFSPSNKGIIEMDPLSSRELFTLTYVPFTLLSIACLAQLKLLSRKIKLSPELFLSALLIIGIIACGIACRRTILFAVPILVCETAHLWRLSKQCSEETSELSLVATRSTSIPSIVFLQAVICLSASIGAYVCSVYWTSPTLPKSSVVFQVPFKSVEYIAKFKPQGRVLDFAPFGDVLIWRMKDVPPLFIDTRYNMYSGKVFDDYRCMQHCKAGWKELLDQYNISWVYMPPQTEIAQQLEHAKRWKEAYKDQTAEIFTRLY